MGGLRDWYADFNLGEFLGIGLDTAQIGHLAGSLFLTLFGLAALRRVAGSSGILPAVWIAVAMGLLAGAFLIAARGFPEQIPDEARPWTEPERLTRSAALLTLVGWAAILLWANQNRRPFSRLASRIAGLVLAGVAVWLATGWFGEEVPEEVRDWTSRTIVTRAIVVLGLLFLAGTFWVRRSEGVPHVRWFNRTLAPPAAAIAVLLALKWFSSRVPAAVPWDDVRFVTMVLAAVATGTCLFIAGGAYLMRERPPLALVEKDNRIPLPRRVPVVSSPPLPVALLLDDRGQPLPPPRSGNGRPSGA